MSLLFLKFLFATVIVLVILAAGWYPFKHRKTTCHEHSDFPIGETLATGVFLGAALLHMLPEANTLFEARGFHYPFAYIIMGAVFLFFLWFEHLGTELYTTSCTANEKNHPAFAVLAWFLLSLHSLILGAALGLTDSRSLAIMLFLAIVVHKWAESFAIALQLTKSSLSAKKSRLFFVSFSLMTPAGMLIGGYFNHTLATHSLFDPIIIAISAGTFLYLGTLHGLERCVMVQRCCNLRDFSFVIIGFLLMAGVAAFL